MKSRLKKWQEGKLLIMLVRGLALVLALVLYLLFPETRPLLVPGYVLVSLAIIYSVFRISYPLYWYKNNFVTYGIVTFDVVFCCFLPFVSGGIHSPFILYPLTAILSVALFFKQSITNIIAVLVAVSVISSELFSWRILHTQQYLPVQVYVTLLAMYAVVGFLIGWLPYIANLNLSANIKKDTIVEERSRLSRELHDSLAQRLSSSILKLDILRETVNGAKTGDAISQIANIKRDVQETYLEVRETIDQLRVKMPEGTHLMTTIAEYTQEFSNKADIGCKLYLSDGHTDLQPLATVEILRIVQESLNNVKKHSGADQIEVKYESTPENVKVIIRDNGKGFVPSAVKGQHGLTVMKERAEAIGGTLDVISYPGRGTSIEIVVPVHNHRRG